MTTATAPNRRNLSPAQRDALAEIEQYGAVALSDPFGRSNQRTLQSLVDRGLAEWHEADVLRVYPRIVPVGTSARWRAAAAAEAERKAQARLARIDLLAADPRALAEAVVALEEARHTHGRDNMGRLT